MWNCEFIPKAYEILVFHFTFMIQQLYMIQNGESN